MYEPNTIKLYREGTTLFIETQDDTYEHYSLIRGFDELPLGLDKRNLEILGEKLPGGFQPLPTDTIVMTTEGQPPIHFKVQDIEISSFEYVDFDDIEVSVNYVIVPETSEVITEGNAATQAVQDALFELGYEYVSFRDIATNSSVPREYVMLPPNSALYFDDVRVSYKFSIDVNNNLIHLGITALRQIQFDREVDSVYLFNNKDNDDNLNAWLTVDVQFRLRSNTCQRIFASQISAGMVKSMFDDAKTALLRQYDVLKTLNMLSK